MVQKLSLTEELAFTTVRIECDDAHGNTSSGTGFFYRFVDEASQHIPAIITNKHVIEGSVRGRFIMTLDDGRGGPAFNRHQAFEFDSFAQRWLPHPNADIDLCVMLVAPLLLAAIDQGEPLYFKQVSPDFVITQDELDEMGLLEEILMIGYPNGIWDRHNNMPIFRRGTTATHPNLNWNGKPEFLIDAACFPGSSGSPVFLFNQGGQTTSSAEKGPGSGRVKLLGVMCAGPQHTLTGEAEAGTMPTATKPNNLGIVIKAHLLDDFETMFRQLPKQPVAAAPQGSA